MTGNVILKSFSNGIRVRLSEEPSFEQILRETRESFADAAAFSRKLPSRCSFKAGN